MKASGLKRVEAINFSLQSLLVTEHQNDMEFWIFMTHHWADENPQVIVNSGC